MRIEIILCNAEGVGVQVLFEDHKSIEAAMDSYQNGVGRMADARGRVFYDGGEVRGRCMVEGGGFSPFPRYGELVLNTGSLVKFLDSEKQRAWTVRCGGKVSGNPLGDSVSV